MNFSQYADVVARLNKLEEEFDFVKSELNEVIEFVREMKTYIPTISNALTEYKELSQQIHAIEVELKVKNDEEDI
jgi:tetrahydromethanopterin S-methyltransferase subunit G